MPDGSKAPPVFEETAVKKTPVFSLKGILSAAVTAAVMFYAGSLLRQLFLRLLVRLCAPSPEWEEISRLFSGIFVWGTAFALMNVTGRDDWFPELFGDGKRSVRGILRGILCGSFCCGVCILAASAFGEITFPRTEPKAPAALLFLTLPAVFITAGGEEIVCRLYLRKSIFENSGSAAASVLLSSLFFTALHLGNPGVTGMALANTFAAGTVLALLSLRYDSVWPAMGFHTAWNFMQTYIFGLPNSGRSAVLSLLSPVILPAGSGWACGSVFGIEGAPLTLAVMGTASAVIAAFSKRKNAQRH